MCLSATINIFETYKEDSKQVPVYWSLQHKMYAKYVNNQQGEVPAVDEKIKNSSSKVLNELHLPLC